MYKRQTFNLFGNGRNFAGIDSQVFLPITTALRIEESLVAEVNCRKYFISLDSLQGREPWYPIPYPGIKHATTQHTEGLQDMVYLIGASSKGRVLTDLSTMSDPTFPPTRLFCSRKPVNVNLEI